MRFELTVMEAAAEVDADADALVVEDGEVDDMLAHRRLTSTER